MAELFDHDAMKMEETVPAIVEESLVSKAIDKGLDAESIKMLIELANKQEDRRAKQDFDYNFSQMQSELPAITKTAKGYNYMYARLEDLQKLCNPIISKHGFSYSWREESIDSGKRTILSIKGYGYVQENFFDAPILTGTTQMNSVQVAGAMSTYGRRYTFIAGFGLTVEGEDNDAEFDVNEELQKYITLINTAPDIKRLSEVFSEAWNAYKTNKIAAKILSSSKDARKKALA